MSDAVRRFKYGYKNKPSHAFFLFILWALLAATVASTSSPFSAATQCGPFSITYGDNPSPLNLLILPFDAEPIISNLTNSLHDPVSRTWNHTLDKLPLKSGTQFIVTLDYGDGAPFSRMGVLT